MTLAASVWSIIFDSAEHNESVRAALAADIAKRCDRTWHTVILPALEGPGHTQQRVDCEAAMAPAYPPSPAGEAEPPFLGDSLQTPCPGRPTPAGALEGAK